jgi:hypothetical protein
MPDKGVGFLHNINLSWLDAAAESRLRNEDISSIRNELEQFLKQDLKGDVSRRKTIDVLIGIWYRTALVDQNLYDQALAFYPLIQPHEHIWLHYGLALLYYPFFRQTLAIIGQFARTGEPITRQAIKGRLAGELGHLGSLNRASERIVASLVDWGALVHPKKGNLYIPQLQIFKTNNLDMQSWLLACGLSAHPSEQLPLPDLIRLPELFPFQFTVTLDGFRKNTKFTVQKQGMWDMVGLQTLINEQ